jgi:hypothetical protein
MELKVSFTLDINSYIRGEVEPTRLPWGFGLQRASSQSASHQRHHMQDVPTPQHDVACSVIAITLFSYPGYA